VFKIIKNTKGFALIELIMVVLVLSVLTAIAVPTVTGLRETAEERSLMAQAVVASSSISNAIASTGGVYWDPVSYPSVELYPWGGWCSWEPASEYPCDEEVEAAYEEAWENTNLRLLDFNGNVILDEQRGDYRYYVPLSWKMNTSNDHVFVVVSKDGFDGYAYAGTYDINSHGHVTVPSDVSSFPAFSQNFYTTIVY